MSEQPKRRGRPPGSGNPTLKLVCLVTGNKRNSNINYLNRKAERCEVSIDVVVNNYVSKEALKSIADSPNFNDETKELLLRLNGGTRSRRKKNEA
jgi:hypothetical protein